MSPIFTSTQIFFQKKRILTTIILMSFVLLSSLVNAQNILVGLTSNGGAEGRGTVFSVNTSGSNYSIIKTFADWGKIPTGDLLQGADGNFYGMTNVGGTYNYGTIFMMTPTGAVTVLK